MSLRPASEIAEECCGMLKDIGLTRERIANAVTADRAEVAKRLRELALDTDRDRELARQLADEVEKT